MIVRNHMAILRNLRNIREAGVDQKHIDKLLRALDHPSWGRSRVLPFRFIVAAKAAPQWENEIEKAMFKSVAGLPKLPGRTILLVDVSGSMNSAISTKSELLRYDAANGLAILARELAENAIIYSFSNKAKLIPARRGFALRDAIAGSQDHMGTNLGEAISYINQHERYDRLIVLTDEQSHDEVGKPNCEHAYIINVAGYQNGVGYGLYTHISGWSENCLAYIAASEGITLETSEDAQS